LRPASGCGGTADGERLFKKTEITRQTQMEPAPEPTVEE
jgi:hypothetical protein